ncbi:MAG: NAD-dependent epimerase/dehydratase family protein [Blastocatellia bacterium]|nr:NAD-dependent epimerase/dehydratase family protein [Blastocatellia bacterium]
MNILVTGGAGFIGSHLVDALVERGHRVRILDSLVEQVHAGRVPEYLNAAAEFVRADVCDAEAVAAALDGIDAVFHEAAEVGVTQSMYEIVRYVRANDLGTAVLLEEVVRRRDQIKKLIVTSSNTIYGEGTRECGGCGVRVDPPLRTDAELQRREWDIKCDACGVAMRPAGTREDRALFPTTIYAATKLAQDQYSLAVGRAYKIPTVALRYFNVYGTRQALSNPYTGVCAIFSARLMNGQAPVVFEDGGQMRDFTHVSDIVQANLLALDSDRADYESLNVGTGRATSVAEIARLIAAGLGKDIEPEITGQYREGDIRHCIADVSKISRLLGFEPKVELEDGLGVLLKWVAGAQVEDRVVKANAELESRSLIK